MDKGVSFRPATHQFLKGQKSPADVLGLMVLPLTCLPLASCLACDPLTKVTTLCCVEDGGQRCLHEGAAGT